MFNNLSEAAIDRIVAACNGDMRGAVKALLLVNEQLEAELAQPTRQPAWSPGAATSACTRLLTRQRQFSLLGSTLGQALMVERASLASSSDL